ADFDDLRDYAGVAWYWRPVTLEAPEPGDVLLLRFGAVDYRAEVFVNGFKAAGHEGGYLPFELDVTSLVRAGTNQLAVRVTDPGGKTVWEDSRPWKPGETRAEFSGQVVRPMPWDLSNPALYSLTVRLSSGDEEATPFGFRSFETRGGKFFLNGKVLYLRGALD